MGKRDPRIDAYIDEAADFAKPILHHLREAVHEACPDVEETIKWSAPFFDHHGPMCTMAAFKRHCAFGFWKAPLVLDDLSRSSDSAGHLGRITSLKDLPVRKKLLELIRKASQLNETGVKLPKRPAKSGLRTELPVPDDLLAALQTNASAATAFESFPPSHRREYVEWIMEAKLEATRKKRVEQAIAWLSEGKSRNWKYLKK